MFTLTWACTSFAQTPSSLSDRRANPAAMGTVGLDLSIARMTANDVTGITPLAFGVWYLGAHARFDFACALPGAVFPAYDASYFKPGNPMLALSWFTLTRHTSMRVGGAVSFPVARVPGSTGAVDDGSTGRERLLNRIAASARGRWDEFLVQPATLGVGVPMHYDVLVHSWFNLGLDVGAFVLVCTASDQCGATRIVAQGAVDAGAIWQFLRGGIRVQGVTSSRRDTDDAQSSVEPYVEATAGLTTYRMSFVMNLDAPAGFSFANGGIWALHFGIRTTT